MTWHDMDDNNHHNDGMGPVGGKAGLMAGSPRKSARSPRKKADACLSVLAVAQKRGLQPLDPRPRGASMHEGESAHTQLFFRLAAGPTTLAGH